MTSSRAERQLILVSAGTAARRTGMREYATGLAGEVDWSRFAETLRMRKLLALLGPRILELAGETADSDFGGAVEQAVLAGRRQGAFIQLLSLRVMAMLAAADVRCAALKGPLLSEAIYGDPGRRLSSDIDLLVSPEQLPAAVEVVRTLGYAAPEDHLYEHGLPLLHFVLAHEQGELPPVELHWRIHWYEASFAHERLLPPSVNPEGDWRPAPADELAALLLFYARDGFVDVRLATDLGAWWDVSGGELAPGVFDELLSAYPALARVILTAAEVAVKIVGLPAGQIAAGIREPGLRERAAVRLANPNPHSSQSQLYADMGLIDGLLAPRGGFAAFVRRQLLPRPEVREEQARHGAKQRARSPLSRFAGILARYGITMAGLVRPRETLP